MSDDKLGEGTHGSVWVLDDRRVEKRTKMIDRRSYGIYLSDGLLTELATYERVSNACCRHVVKIHEWETEGETGPAFISKIIMERLAPLQNLESDILRSGARYYIKQILEAIHDLHSEDIAHCDLKLDNVMYDFVEDELKLIDFGLAKMDSSVKPPDKAMFTFDYRPPEALLLSNNIDLRKADMWSIGVCAASIILGKGARSIYYEKMHDLGWKGSLDVILRSLNATLPKISSNSRYSVYTKSRAGTRENWKNPGWLWEKIRRVAGDDGVNFIECLLDVNPSSRMTAEEALQHPYLSSCTRTFPRPPRNSPFEIVTPNDSNRVDPRVINEIVSTCITEKLCPETAFKTLDILSIMKPEYAEDPKTVAAAIMVASSVGENRLIHMRDLYKLMAPWVSKRQMMESVCEVVAYPGVISVLSSHTVLHMAWILNKKIRGTKDDPVVARLFHKYIERNGYRPREIDILECAK